MPAPQSSRDRFLAVARAQFAGQGFERTSIAAIAGELGLTKQALLHHFGTKKKLYAEILAQIATRHIRAAERLAARKGDPAEQLRAVLLESCEEALRNRQDARLLMRELLDNQGRADQAERWFLQPLLDHYTDMLLTLPGWQGAARADALASIYQLVGAIQYFAVSQTTLEHIYGARQYGEMEQKFPGQLGLLIDALIAGGQKAHRAKFQK